MLNSAIRRLLPLLDRIPPVVYFAIKCVKTGVVINDQQNIGTIRRTVDGQLQIQLKWWV